MVAKKTPKRIKKEVYWTKLWELAEKYKKVILVDCDNVSGQQICSIRMKLRSLDAVMLMGKNVRIPSFLIVL
jgi:ribosomal protein L10